MSTRQIVMLVLGTLVMLGGWVEFFRHSGEINYQIGDSIVAIAGMTTMMFTMFWYLSTPRSESKPPAPADKKQ